MVSASLNATMPELPGMNLPALRKFLLASGVPVNGELSASLLAGGRSNLTFKVCDEQSQWVVRRPPVSGLTPSAHDMRREWTVTHALGHSGVPVAATLAMSEDPSILGAPFTVVDFVEGIVIRDQADLGGLSDAQLQGNLNNLIHILAKLHDVDQQAIGLASFGKPGHFLQRQVNLWSQQWQRVKTRDLADVARLHRALEEAMPASHATSIVHGDFRIDNAILNASDPRRILAVVDWEMSTVGDPLTDVALMCAYRQPIFDTLLGMQAAWTSPRYPDADDLAQRYATVSGRNLDHWGFYMALANFKLGVIGEGITHRALSGSDTGKGADKAAHATRAFMAAGLAALGQ